MDARDNEALALKAIREKAKKSKEQTPGATRITLQAGSRLRKRLAEERKYLKKHAPDMSAADKKQYMANIKKLSRQLEGTGKEKYSQGNFYMFGGKKSSAGQYDDAQTALEEKNERKKAGLDTPPGKGKFNKGGMVKKYNMGGRVPTGQMPRGGQMPVSGEVPTYAGMPMMADGGVVPKKKKKKVSKKKSIDGVARRGRTKGRMV